MPSIGKIAVVTGGASGIGKATVERLSAAGATVICADIDVTAGQKMVSEAGNNSGAIDFLKLDLTDDDQILEFANDVIEKYGKLDILVNAAGGGDIEPFIKNDPKRFDWNVALNYLGPVKLTHAFLPAMSEAKEGKIVYVASDAGRVGSGGETVYAGAKGGIIAFAKSLAREVARFKINVNCVCPGPTDTPLLQTRPEKMLEALISAIPLHRFAKPEEIANAIQFFADADSDYITGQVLSVSGGLTMVD
ncbi:MAG: SDR family oxidoreductase [Rhodospirillaceae bacterium]|jgi:2-hydroxycyclohexanecarboxyl-CoA dehydrogenase|nr:SDR family oxidoreductase [Rhodospirillaceae bacterium]MBT4589567.1 SDR family oxidoreductase [Rhodospirillaceae bacterium]MBT5941030.1 SDR family oxidoreductase [Rhodospirillaceae bacterium]MBT7265568.1 SDR family oxidoreductase [Rhodospirillaceae bacterium]